MASDVQAFDATVPAGTPQNAPAVISLAMPPRTVMTVEIRVPPGPRGVMGFQLASGGLQVIPATPGAFIVTDDEVITWQLANYLETGAWELIGYNTGAYDHTLHLRFLCDVIGLADALQPSLLSAASLSSAPAAAPTT